MGSWCSDCGGLGDKENNKDRPSNIRQVKYKSIESMSRSNTDNDISKTKITEEVKDAIDSICIHCKASDIHNAVQFPDNKLFIDIRSSDEYNQHHIQQFINIPINCDKNVIEDRIQESMSKMDINYTINVYFCADKDAMKNGGDIKWYKYIEQLTIKNAKTDDDEYEFSSWYTLNIDYETFFNSFKFLCVDIDNYPISMAIASHYPSIIIDNKLYLGDYGDATSMEVMLDLNITHILNVSNLDNAFEDDERLPHLKYLHHVIEDEPDQQINEIFDECIAFIVDALDVKNDDNNHKVLVHCAAGISRSTTIMIAYFMKTKNMSYHDALQFILSKREIVGPNQGFEKQLKVWEKK